MENRQNGLMKLLGYLGMIGKASLPADTVSIYLPRSIFSSGVER
jgi:hypothetical protein